MMLFATIALAILNVATALPVADISVPSAFSLAKRAVSCPGTGQKQFLPALRTINDNATSPTVIHVSNSSTATITQVATFPNIPASASNFVLWWAQSAPSSEFTTTGGGTVAVYYLDTSKLPATGTLTPEAVDAAIDTSVGPFGTGRIGSAAFGGWPDVKTAQDHLVGIVEAPATTAMSFRMTLQEPGDVRMVQDDRNGWFLGYDC